MTELGGADEKLNQEAILVWNGSDVGAQIEEKRPKKRNVPDSKSHGTLARTALPQVLLKNKTTWKQENGEWHRWAIRRYRRVGAATRK
jgi:hypothetical protein